MPKRAIKKFDFTGEGSHVAICSRSLQGGAANGYTTVLMKSAGTELSEKEVVKNVTVELSMQDFLSKFFHLWYEDAEILARALGFDAQAIGDDDFEQYINDKVAQITITKGDVEATVKGLTVHDVLELAELQKSLQDSEEFTNFVVKSDEDSEEEQPDSKAELNTVNKGDENMSEMTLEKALDENNKLQAKLDELEKANISVKKAETKELVKKLSFVDEGSQDEVVDILFKSSVEGSAKVIELLVKAQEAIDALATSENGHSEESQSNADEDQRTNTIKAALAKLA